MKKKPSNKKISKNTKNAKKTKTFEGTKKNKMHISQKNQILPKKL